MCNISPMYIASYKLLPTTCWQRDPHRQCTIPDRNHRVKEGSIQCLYTTRQGGYLLHGSTTCCMHCIHTPIYDLYKSHFRPSTSFSVTANAFRWASSDLNRSLKKRATSYAHTRMLIVYLPVPRRASKAHETARFIV